MRRSEDGAQPRREKMRSLLPTLLSGWYAASAVWVRSSSCAGSSPWGNRRSGGGTRANSRDANGAAALDVLASRGRRGGDGGGGGGAPREHVHHQKQQEGQQKHCAVLDFLARRRGGGSDGVDKPHPHAPQTHEAPHVSSRPRPERGKVLAQLTAEDMYDAYCALRREYQEKAFAPTNQGRWRLLKERADVRVSMLQHPDDPHCPYVRMNGIIPASVQDCWNFLLVSNWDASMPKMDPFYEGVSVIGTYSHDDSGVEMILCRKRTKRILAFGKRDLVFLSVADASRPLEDGTWVSGSVSVVTPRVPRQPGYTRAFQDSVAFYQPLDNNTRTNLTIVCRIDLNDSGQGGAGGFIPMWLYVKTIGVTAVESVLRMRNAIVSQLQEQQQ